MIRIFELHTQGVSFDPTRSGAEYWFQVRTQDDDDDEEKEKEKDELEEEEEDGEYELQGESIKFHWDKDEVLSAMFQVDPCKNI